MIAGGVESMTRAPFVMGKADSAFSRVAKIEDTTIGWRFVNPLMKEKYGIDSMPETAENVAVDFKVARADQDAFALRSQQRAGRRRTRPGSSSAEIVPVTLPQRKGDPKIFDTDEHPRPDTTLEALAKLKGVVKPEGTVTAGNASGRERRRVRADPRIGSGREEARADASRARRRRGDGRGCAAHHGHRSGAGDARSCSRGSVSRSAQMDVIELNEAFAAQGLAVIRDLGLPDDAAHVNPNGGAIAIGHPLGASGARLVTTALNQLERIRGRYGLCTMCIGVGQGIALVIERV